MRVLLTGASGFIGRHTLDALVRRGIDVVVVGRTPPAQSDVDFIAADLLATTSFATILSEARATHLLHLAWYAEHGKYWTSPLNLRWVEASVRLIEAFCIGGGGRIVVAGTCAEYDWAHGWCREETTPLEPATLYGKTKDATRRLAMAVAAEHGVSCAWGRIFLPFGAGEVRSRLVPSLIDVFTGRRPPFGVNATAYRDFLHVKDVAEAFITLLTDEATGAINIASGRPVPLASVVETLADLLGGRAADVLDLTVTRPGEPSILAGENAKLLALGWRPAFSLLQGLESAVSEEAR